MRGCGILSQCNNGVRRRDTHRFKGQITLEDQLPDLSENLTLGVGEANLSCLEISHTGFILLLCFLCLE